MITRLDQLHKLTPSTWEVLDAEEVVSNPWMKVRREKCRRENGAIIPDYYLFEGTNWVNVLPVTPDGIVTLIYEYRHGVGGPVLGLPGGIIDSTDVIPEQAARRELEEETGIRDAKLVCTGDVYVNPWRQDNLGTSFIALHDSVEELKPLEAEPELVVLHCDIQQLVPVTFSGAIRFSGFELAAIQKAFFWLSSSRNVVMPKVRDKVRNALDLV